MAFEQINEWRKVMPKGDDEEEEKEEKMPHKVLDKVENSILDSRRIFLCDAVDNDTCSEIIRKLWYLDLKDPGKPIYFVINSPGGSVDAGFAIWDQVQMIHSPVTTIVTGLAASMGSVLSLCAAPKKRLATPRARFMIHQPMLGGVIKGQATDLDIQAREMIKTRHKLIEIYVKATGKDYETISKAIDRDTWLSAEEALEFGLLDAIISSYKELK